MEKQSSLSEVFVALGGNIGNTAAVFNQALVDIGSISGIENVQVSRYYHTSPVSSIPQNDYLNAVCRFSTSLDARTLLKILQKIEMKLGKRPKPKDAPRIIDLDILFFGDEVHQDSDLEIPHPRWMERLFVLQPLADLVTYLTIPGKEKSIDLTHFLKTFENSHREVLVPYPI